MGPFSDLLVAGSFECSEQSLAGCVHTGPILATLFIIVIGKSVAAFLIVRAVRYPVGTALMISASLAQIGEFSFILAELGIGLNLLPEQGRDLILGGALLSICLNPLAFAALDWLHPWIEKRTAKASPDETQPSGQSAVSAAAEVNEPPPKTALDDHTILVGYGRVGSLIGQSLKEARLPFLVIEDADKTVAMLRADEIETIVGNAANAEVFKADNPAGARRLILAIPNAFEAGQIVLRARAANPSISIIARAHSDAEVEHLTGLGTDTVIMGEREIACGIVEVVLNDLTAAGPKPPTSEPEPRLLEQRREGSSQPPDLSGPLPDSEHRQTPAV
jgi:monovalent cation:H+ antiporter-2, CPA2 family